MAQDLFNEDVIVTRFQELKRDVIALRNKVSTSLELMNFEVKLYEDFFPKDTKIVLTKARNLLQSLIQIEDVNTF